MTTRLEKFVDAFVRTAIEESSEDTVILNYFTEWLHTYHKEQDASSQKRKRKGKNVYGILVVRNDYSEWFDRVGGDFEDVKAAEKARSGYLALYPDFDPQNVQVVQYNGAD